MSETKHAPRSGQTDVELSESLAAYIVYLIWCDAPRWDPRRRLHREEALDLAERLATLLTPEVRMKLERVRYPRAA